MLYLIGGSPRSGKSILSQELSQKLNCELVSVDAIRKLMISKISEQELTSKFSFEKMYTGNNDEFFGKYSPKEILTAEIKEAEALWPEVEKIINDNLLAEYEAVIEGVQLLPKLLKKFKNNKNIKIVYLYKKDKKLIKQAFAKNSKNNDWILNNTKQQITLEKAALTFSFYGDYFKSETKKYSLNSINTENDFKNKIQKAINMLINS